MKKLFLLLATLFAVGCGATVDRHVVTLTDVDPRLAEAYGADVRWIDLADNHERFDRDLESEPDEVTKWTSLCESSCSALERWYSSVLEDVAETAFVAGQLRQISVRSDRERFRPLAELGEPYVSPERLETLERQLDLLDPRVDFERPLLRRRAEEAIRQAEENLQMAREALPASRRLIAELSEPATVVSRSQRGEGTEG